MTITNTGKKETKPKSASAIEREIAALTRLYTDGHLTAAQHKERYDELLGTGPAMTMAEFLDGDICSSKHGGSLESKDAFASVRPGINALHHEILDAYEKFGDLTSKEIAGITARPLHSVSGRCTELKALCFLEKTGLRRDGSAVLRRTDKRRP